MAFYQRSNQSPIEVSQARHYDATLEQLRHLFDETDHVSDSVNDSENDVNRTYGCGCGCDTDTDSDSDSDSDPYFNPNLAALVLAVMSEILDEEGGVSDNTDTPPSYEEAMTDPQEPPPPPYEEVEEADEVEEVDEEVEEEVEEEEEEEVDEVDIEEEVDANRVRMDYDYDYVIMSFRDVFGRLTIVFMMIHVLLSNLMTHMKLYFKVKQLSGWRKILLVMMYLLKFNVKRSVIQLEKLNAKQHILGNFNEQCQLGIMTFDRDLQSAKSTKKLLIILFKIILINFSIGVTQMLLMMHLKVHQGLKKVMGLIMDQVDLNKSVQDELMETFLANDYRLFDIRDEYEEMLFQS
jgi:hypothetical protein